MRVLHRGERLILAPDTDDDTRALDDFASARAGHVLRLDHDGSGLQLTDLGPEDDARNVALNIISRAPAPYNLISNFARAPFKLDGRPYASTEGFWQGLKFPDKADRKRIAALHGLEAKEAGESAVPAASFLYNGSTIIPGTWDHWQLMLRACRAKFTQDALARAALLATGDRPLIHKVRKDSRTIPGAIMAEIWMGLRAGIRKAEAMKRDASPPDSVMPGLDPGIHGPRASARE